MGRQEFVQDELRCALLWDRQHKKQRECSMSNKPIRVLFWGNRCGKTRWGGQEVCMYLFNSHVNEGKKIELPVEVWIGCPSYDVQLDTTQKVLDELIPHHRIKKITEVKSGVWGRVQLDNGSLITFKSYDQGREKFQGAGKRLIWLDEECPKDIWQECTLRTEAGVPLDIIYTMTPVNGMTWVYDELYLATDNPNLFVSTATWQDNPWLTKEQKEQMTYGLSQESLAVRERGEFVQRTGLVCYWWDRTKHLVDDIVLQSGWNVYRVIDFGWSSSKTCVLWIAVDTYDRCLIFDGLYVNQTDDDELSQLIKERESEFRVTKGWADNQPDRIKNLSRHGIICEAIKNKSDKEGWDMAKAEAMAKIGKVDPITGKTRLQVSRKLMYKNKQKGSSVNWFVEEIEGLKWGEKRISAGTKREILRWDKESGTPESHFDAMDCFAYFAVMFFERKGKYKEEKKKEPMVKKFINMLAGY